MDEFLSKHQNEINGTLSMYDRIIFKGHLTQLFMGDAFKRFLDKQAVLLKDFKTYATNTTEELKAEVKDMASRAGRPYTYLDRAVTKATDGQSKEELAQAIAAKDGISEGLICIFSTLEMCRTFSVRGNHQTHKLEVVREKRKCLHFYFYYLDTEFGFMHVRLQSWFPFAIQVYINGREWLGRQLQKQGIRAQRYDNCFLAIDDLPTAQQLCQRFAHREWHRVLDAFARRVNPKLAMVETAGFGTYYWVTDQCEVAIDVMFKSREALERILPHLMRAATLNFSCENVMRFLGRKLHGNFTGEVITHVKKRPEGWCVRHSMAGNSIKMYDKYSVLRIETTLNNSREFKVLKRTGNQWRWTPMGKGVANIWRYYEVAIQADQRYLNALANVDLKGEAIQELDDLCRSHTKNGKRYAKFNPVANADTRIFAAAIAGHHLINGFRNGDLCARLYHSPPPSLREAKQRCTCVSRVIAKLRGHNLIAKVKNSRLYRVTNRGYRLMSAALSFRQTLFPQALQLQTP
jgi:hypothetical protein